MSRRTLFSEIKKINEITKVVRSETENLGVNVAFRVLPSGRQINEFCRSVGDLKKVAEHMKKLQKASTRLAAAREGVPIARRRVKKIYRPNPDTIGLNVEKVERELGLPGAARERFSSGKSLRKKGTGGAKKPIDFSVNTEAMELSIRNFNGRSGSLGSQIEKEDGLCGRR